MLESLADYRKQRAMHAMKEFLKQMTRTTFRQANLFAQQNWPAHGWGIGQNGSIAGIVVHVTAWKEFTLPVLQGNTQMPPTHSIMQWPTPNTANWKQTRQWAAKTADEWQQAVEQLQDSDWQREVLWENDYKITLGNLVDEILEHDIQHAAQIEYLLQRIATENSQTAAHGSNV